MVRYNGFIKMFGGDVMKFTIMQQFITPEGRIEWLRYYLDAEDEEKAREIFINEIIPRHIAAKNSPYWRGMPQGEPLIREFIQGDDGSYDNSDEQEKRKKVWISAVLLDIGLGALFVGAVALIVVVIVKLLT